MGSVEAGVAEARGELARGDAAQGAAMVAMWPPVRWRARVGSATRPGRVRGSNAPVGQGGARGGGWKVALHLYGLVCCAGGQHRRPAKRLARKPAPNLARYMHDGASAGFGSPVLNPDRDAARVGAPSLSCANTPALASLACTHTPAAHARQPSARRSPGLHPAVRHHGRAAEPDTIRAEPV